MCKLMAKAIRTDGGWAVWASDCGGRGFIELGVVPTLQAAREAVMYLQA